MLKPGGGNHLQHYDSSNGQYSDEDREKFSETDFENLISFYFYGLDYDDIIFHFPVDTIHDKKYFELFVKYSRENYKEIVIDKRKISYFATPTKNNDKSFYLFDILGFSRNNIDEIYFCFKNNTNFKTLEFSRFKYGKILCEAQTIIKLHLVTSIWELTSDMNLRLVTFIPGGDKRWR